MSVTVYSTPTCPYCKMVKEFLNENKVEFNDVNVAEDRDAAKQIMQKSGQMGVPQIDVNGKIIVGFDKDSLKKELNL